MYFRAFIFRASNYGRIEVAAETDLSLLTAAERHLKSNLEKCNSKICFRHKQWGRGYIETK